MKFFKRINSYLKNVSFIHWPAFIFKNLTYRLKGKKITSDHATLILGLHNIQTEGHLSIGQAGSLSHPDEKTFLDIRGTLIVKDSSYLGKGSRVQIAKGGKCTFDGGHFSGLATIVIKHSLTVGKGSVIAWNTEFLDWNSHKIVYEGREEKARGIAIGEHVWIGSGAKILQGVTIGNGCMVAANSVVTKSFPDNVLIGGNPAKILKENVRWENYECE